MENKTMKIFLNNVDLNVNYIMYTVFIFYYFLYFITKSFF